MNLLAMDTTSEYIVLALKKEETEEIFISEKGCKKHNSALLSHVDVLLKKHGLTLSDIDVFGVAVGPGSFTGIRVGVATVNAFSLALGKKTVEVTTLELPVKEDNVMTLLDCKHGNYYCGIFVDGEAEYKALNSEETEEYNFKKIYMEGVFGEELLRKCVEKAERGEFTVQAKPFYLKKSSAERETGIQC